MCWKNVVCKRCLFVSYEEFCEINHVKCNLTELTTRSRLSVVSSSDVLGVIGAPVVQDMRGSWLGCGWCQPSQ